MKSLIVYFGCGSYTKRKEGLAGDFRVTKLEDIFIKIIPFFRRYQLIGEKKYKIFKIDINVLI